jgi:hypothetical protein
VFFVLIPCVTFQGKLETFCRHENILTPPSPPPLLILWLLLIAPSQTHALLLYFFSRFKSSSHNLLIGLTMSSCPLCNYSSTSKWNLNRHIKTHEKMSQQNVDSDWCCQYCYKVFSKKYNCKRHENVCPHKCSFNGEKPEKVALAPEKVALAPEKVALAPEKVAREETTLECAQEKLECDMCYKYFSCRWNLVQHMKTCKGISHPLMCPKCRLVLSSKYAKSRHVKGCDGTRNEHALVVIEPDSVLSNLPNVCTRTTAPLPSCSVGGPNHNYVQAEKVVMNQQTVNITQQNIIQINGFGNEDLSRVLDPQYLDERLRELNGKGIFRMVKDIHMNPDIPENQNIRIGSKKSKTLKVFHDDGKWHVRANSDILEILMGKYKSILTRRCFDPDFKGKLKYESDLMQIQQDLLKFDKKTNCTAYYACAHKILALIQDLEIQAAEHLGCGQNTTFPTPFG